MLESAGCLIIMMLNVSILWKVKTSHKFNAVAFGKLFKQGDESIVAVGEDGIVQVYRKPLESLEKEKVITITPVRNFETKCGPASHIMLKDITRLSPCDMLVADTRGTVVLFCDGQILVRRFSLSGKTSRVTALEVQETGLGSVHVIVGKDDGELTCFNTFSLLWKLRLSDLNRERMVKTISVTCIIATAITMSTGHVGDYVLVSDSDGYLHVIENGEVVKSITINSVVTSRVTCHLRAVKPVSNKASFKKKSLQCRAIGNTISFDRPWNEPSHIQQMAHGNFLIEESQRQSSSATQIALGCKDGCIWVMVDFTVDTSAPYANIGHPITQLRRLPAKRNYASQVNSAENGIVDLLLCGGHFHSLKVFQHGKVIYSLSLSSWPVSICGFNDWMDAESREHDKTDNSILIGCQDASLQCVEIT